VGENEIVCYDRAILFKYGKDEILISSGNTLPGRFEIHHRPDVIKSILAPLTLRKEII